MQLPPILIELQNGKQDGIAWQAQRWLDEAGGDPYKKGAAGGNIAKLLSLVGNPMVRDEYVKLFVKEYKFNKKELEGSVSNARALKADELEGEAEPFGKLPDWVEDPAQVYSWGFAERLNGIHTGYWFLSGASSMVQATNYVVTPLYHLYSQKAESNRRMMAVNNGFTESIVEVPSKGALSADMFSAHLFNEGNYRPLDSFSTGHLRKLWNKLSDKFALCHELEQLGWQHNEGFFAFSNMTYLPPAADGEKGALNKYNEYGVATVDNRNFLSPSNGKGNENVRSSENIYENDLYLSYKPSPINFSQWCELMVKVYEKNAWMAIPFAVATLFRDIVVKVTKMPLLYGYGPVGSGKSEWGESIFYLFFSGLDSQGELYKPFNLNQGTDFAFFNTIERFMNCPGVFNEFDENSIDDARFRAFKAAYDGEGRAKGMKEKNRATMQKINGTFILLGQFLGTKDDNAVLMRSLPFAFRRNDDRTQQQIDDFNLLKNYQHKGLSGILVELMEMRVYFKTHLVDSFSKTRNALVAALKAQNTTAPERIIKNVALMASVVALISKRVTLPYTFEDFFDFSVDFIIRMSALIASTSGISEFWGMVEFLLDRGLIQEGKDFEIKNETSVTITTDGKGEDKVFTTPKTVLYIRIGSLHKLYQENYRKGTGRAALNETTLLLYMKDQPYYLGWVKAKRFKKLKTTSCHAIDYDMLGCNLVREMDNEFSIVVVQGMVLTPPQQVNISDDIYKFFIEEYTKDDPATTTTNKRIITCYSHDPNVMGQVQKGYRIQLRGGWEENHQGNKPFYTIHAVDYESLPAHRAFERTLDGSPPPANPQGDLPF